MRIRKHMGRIGAPVAALVTVVGLAGCSSGGSGSGSAHALTIWYRPGSVPASAVKGVQQQFPQVQLKLVQVPDLETKLKVALQTGKGAPDIAVIGNDIASYASIESRFADLKTLGADPTKDYVAWKWANGTTPDGRIIGLPVDTGPQGLFYRTDLFAKAGLPTDPAQVAALVNTWDGYRSLAEKATKAGFSACDDASQVYNLHLEQKGQGYFDTSGTYIGDNDYSHQAFDYSAALLKDGLCAKVTPYSTDFSSALAQNKLGAFVGPVYEGPLIASAGSPSGVWRVAEPPGGPGSAGGSFLSIMSSAKDQKDAYAVISWMMNSANQASGYAQDGLFPSATGAFTSPEMTAPQPYYGGQAVGALFAKVVQASPTVHVAPLSSAAESAIANALTQVEQGQAAPADAWSAAQSQIHSQLQNK